MGQCHPSIEAKGSDPNLDVSAPAGSASSAVSPGVVTCQRDGCTKPTYDGQPGFCSRSCRAAGAAPGPGAPICQHCGTKPTWNGQPGFCSKSCRDKGAASQGVVHAISHPPMLAAGHPPPPLPPAAPEPTFFTDTSSVLFTPESCRKPYPTAKPTNPADWIKQFPLLDPNGNPWEQAFYKRVKAKLELWPKWKEAWPHLEKFKFDITEVRIIWDVEQYKTFDSIPLENNKEPFLAFHGTDYKAFHPILTTGFDPKRTNDGWYGNGCYFTNNLLYSQHYIDFRGKSLKNWIQFPAVGNTVYIMGVLLKPGNTLFVTDKSTYRNQSTPAAGYHSHRIFGEPTSWSIGLVAMQEDDRSKSYADEYVIFDAARILPRCIIALHRLPDEP